MQLSRGEQYAQQVNALFCETSALDATNVEELFIQISELHSLHAQLAALRQSLLQRQVPVDMCTTVAFHEVRVLTTKTTTTNNSTGKLGETAAVCRFWCV